MSSDLMFMCFCKTSSDSLVLRVVIDDSIMVSSLEYISLFLVSSSISSFFELILLLISFNLSMSTPILRLACSCLNFNSSFFNLSCSFLTFFNSCLIDCILTLSVWSSFEKYSEMFKTGCLALIDVMAFCNYYSTCTERFFNYCLLVLIVCFLRAISSFLK